MRGVRTNSRTACSTSLLTDVPCSAARRFSWASRRSSKVIVVRMMLDHTMAASLHHTLRIELTSRPIPGRSLRLGERTPPLHQRCIAFDAAGVWWLMTIERDTTDHHGGQHVTHVGPLPLPQAARYAMTAQSALFLPGNRRRILGNPAAALDSSLRANARSTFGLLPKPRHDLISADAEWADVALQRIEEAGRVGEAGEMAAFDGGVSLRWRAHLAYELARRL